MKRLALLALAGSLAAASAHASVSPTNYAGHELSGQAKITLTQARAAALKARPGKILDQELEKEGGGSGLRYSFDVQSHGKTIEVGIDAKNRKGAGKRGGEPRQGGQGGCARARAEMTGCGPLPGAGRARS